MRLIPQREKHAKSYDQVKILYIHQYFSTPNGAVGTRSFEFSRRLVEAGHEVTVLCGTSHLISLEGADQAGINVIQVPISSSNRDGFVKRLCAFIGFALYASWHAVRTKCDLLYATSTPLSIGIPALAAKYIRRRKMIFEVRDLWPELPIAMGIIRNPLAIRVLEWFEKRCYNAADACVGLSPGIVEGIQKKCPTKKVVMIPNGCDLNLFGKEVFAEFKPTSANEEKLLSFLNSQKPIKGRNSLVALFCGAHGKANGLDAILDVAEYLKRQNSQSLQFVFIGDGQMKESLIKRASATDLDLCHFFDPIPKELLARVLAEVDLGLMILADFPAFRYGTSPNKFFDYLAAGLPVLCNYPGWITDLINKWDCGKGVAPNEPQAFAETLIELSHDQNRLNQMAANARELAVAEFERGKLYTKMEKLIVDVMGKS